jgi:hypothetical protein
LLARGVLLQRGPQARVFQGLRHRVQPGNQAARRLHGAQDLNQAFGQGVRQTGRAQGRAPLRHPSFTGELFKREHHLVRPARGLLEQIEHIVHGGAWRGCAQQTHELRGRVGGGEFPAGLIHHSHTSTVQQRADAPDEQPVGGNQSHRFLAQVETLNHTRGCTLRFVFGVVAGMQRAARRVRP